MNAELLKDEALALVRAVSEYLGLTDKALREGAVWGELPPADEVRRLCIDVMQTAYTP